MGRRRDYAKLHGKKIKERFEAKKHYKDERFWELTRDSKGEGDATIRFLPNKNEEELSYYPTFKHSIKINDSYFVDRCPTTLGKDHICPICKWNQDQDDDFVKNNGTYRKKGWISNILVIKDTGNPENEGKVFLFEFGVHVNNILKEALVPDEALEIDPLYFYSLGDDGADFKIIVRKDGAYSSWKKSRFMKEADVSDHYDQFDINDDFIFDNLFDLEEVITGRGYKTKEELEVKFNKFLKSVDIDSITTSTDDADVETYTRKKEKAKDEEIESRPSRSKGKSKKDNDDDEDEKPSRSKGKAKEDDDEEEKKPSRKKRKSKSEDDNEEKDTKKKKNVKNYFDQFDDDDD